MFADRVQQVQTYRETIPWPTWLRVLVVALFLVFLSVFILFRGTVLVEAPGLLWVWDAIWVPSLLGTLVVPILLGRLVIRVEKDALVLRYGFLRSIAKQIPLSLIEGAEAVSYSPIREFGGWGIRRGNFAGSPTAVYSLCGSNGVLLTLASPIETAFLRTNKILIGNRSHRALAEHLSHPNASH